MSILHASPAPVKTVTRYTFRRNPHNPAFGVGVFPQRGRKLPIGPTAGDRAWAAANLNATGITDDEADRLEARTMSAGEYHELVAEVDAEMGHTAWALGRTAATIAEEEAPDQDDATADALAADAEMMDRAEMIYRPAYHILHAADGTPLVVVLDGFDGSDLPAAEDAARRVLDAVGGLDRVSWIGRRDGAVGLLDRDEFRPGEVAFIGLTPIPAAVVEAGFGVRLPAETGGFGLALLAAVTA